ncbi:MAG: hypothetical protein JWO77_1288 [Ilumatobacteraceae bacterium]|nr:hypothetical protein [Ilumatobacteraceae bacterium]
MSGSNQDVPPPGWYPTPDGGERWWDGAQFTDGKRSEAGPQEHPDAVTVLVFGILGIVLCGLLGPFAWAKGSRVVREIDAEPSRYTNRGQAQAGRVLGIVSSSLLVLGLVVVLASTLLVTGGRSSDSSDGPDDSTGPRTEQPSSDPNGPTDDVESQIVKNWQGPVGDAVGMDGSDAQARAASGPGVFIWTDFGGWHVRSNNESEVTVTVTADQVRAKETDDSDDSDEDGDAPFSTEVDLTLPPGDGETGAGFELGNSESVMITVRMDGAEVPASDIKLGGAEGEADENPVVFVKS